MITERILAQTFSRSVNSLEWREQYPQFPHILPEVPYDGGRADFVCTPVEFGALPVDEISALRNPAMTKVISVLYQYPAQNFGDLQYLTQLSEDELFVTLQSLFSLGFALPHGNEFKLNEDSILRNLEIEFWSFELKLTNWRGALYQAIKNQIFAHSVAIVIPQKWSHRLDDRLDLFRRLQIGVVSLDIDSGDAKFLVPPVKKTPGSSYSYYLTLGVFLERAIKHVPKE